MSCERCNQSVDDPGFDSRNSDGCDREVCLDNCAYYCYRCGICLCKDNYMCCRGFKCGVCGVILCDCFIRCCICWLFYNTPERYILQVLQLCFC